MILEILRVRAQAWSSTLVDCTSAAAARTAVVCAAARLRAFVVHLLDDLALLLLLAARNRAVVMPIAALCVLLYKLPDRECAVAHAALAR